MSRPMAYSVIAGIQTANSRHLMGALSEIAGRNLGNKRARLARQHRARVAAEMRRTAPNVLGEPVRASDVPLTFKATQPKRRRVERPATSTVPEPVKAASTGTPQYRPIKAAELPAEIKAVTRRHLADGELSAEWFCVGILDGRDDLTVNVYARKHGASVRYSTGA